MPHLSLRLIRLGTALIGLAVLFSFWASPDRLQSLPWVVLALTGIALVLVVTGPGLSFLSAKVTRAHLLHFFVAANLVALLSALFTSSWPDYKLPGLGRLYGLLPSIRSLPFSWAHNGLAANQTGGMLAVLTVFTVAVAIAPSASLPGGRKRAAIYRGVAMILAVSSVFVVYMTGCRIALAGLGVGVFIVFALRNKRWRWASIGGASLAVAGLASAGKLEQVFHLLVRDQTMTGELVSRLDIWSSSLRALQDHSFTGIGIGVFNQVVPARYPYATVALGFPVSQAHNLFLDVAVSIGLPGLIGLLVLLLGLVLLAARGLFREPRSRLVSACALASMAVFLVYGLTDSMGLSRPTSFILWLWPCLLVLSDARGRTKDAFAQRPQTQRASVGHTERDRKDAERIRLRRSPAFQKTLPGPAAAVLLAAGGEGGVARRGIWLGPFEDKSAGSRAVASTRPLSAMSASVRPHPPARPPAASASARSRDSRKWLLVGAFFGLLVLSINPLSVAWRLNYAGILVNKVIATSAVETTPALEADLNTVTTLMETALATSAQHSFWQAPLLRTLAAAAAREPSQSSYSLLLAAFQAGKLDESGELSLGQIATATGHWQEAADIYAHADGSNLLTSEADTALTHGRRDLAVQEYEMAKQSLQDAVKRETGQEAPGVTTQTDSTAADTLPQQSGERATLLYRIGRGLLAAGQPGQALSALEQASALAAADPPGAVARQELALCLAEALTQTMPAQPKLPEFWSTDVYAIDPAVVTFLMARDRIETLVVEGLNDSRTATAEIQAGQILASAGDPERAIAYVKAGITLAPRSAAGYQALVSIYQSMGLYLQALDTATLGAHQVPGDVALATSLATLSYQEVSATEALPLLERAAKMKASDPSLYAYLGDCYLAAGRTADARSAYLQGLARAPQSKLLVARLNML